MPAAIILLTLICTVASETPIRFATSTNGVEESLFKMSVI